MPLKTWNTKSDFDAAYNIGAERDTGHPNTRPEVRLHYNRAVMFSIAQTHALKMIEVLGLQPTQKIGILGCGFGWVLEVFIAQGFNNVIGTDTSPFIQTNKGLNEDAEIEAAILEAGLLPTSTEGLVIRNKLRGDGGPRSKQAAKVLNEDAMSNPSRNRIRNALGGGNLAWGITDSVLESLTDAECVSLSNAGHGFCTNVAHLVVTTRPGNHAGYNWKTLEAWKALIPADTFIEVGGQWRFL